MVSLYILLLIVIIDNVRKVQFDESFIYLFLITVLGGILFLNLQPKGVGKADLILKGVFIDIFIIQKKTSELFRIFRWLLTGFHAYFAPLKVTSLNNKQVRVNTKKAVKAVVNSVNRFFFTSTMLNFVY